MENTENEKNEKKEKKENEKNYNYVLNAEDRDLLLSEVFNDTLMNFAKFEDKVREEMERIIELLKKPEAHIKEFDLFLIGMFIEIYITAIAMVVDEIKFYNLNSEGRQLVTNAARLNMIKVKIAEALGIDPNDFGNYLSSLS